MWCSWEFQRFGADSCIRNHVVVGSPVDGIYHGMRETTNTRLFRGAEAVLRKGAIVYTV